MPIFTFVLIVLITSVVCHFQIRNFKKAVVVSAVVSAFLFQVLAYISLGYLDPFFIIAFVITGGIAGGCSAVIGNILKKH